MTSPMIHVQNLTKVFKSHKKEPGIKGSITSLFNRTYTEYIAADSISFDIQEGELVGMLGSNGAGKTTTLKMLSGLLHPTHGHAEVMGYVPWKRDNEFRRNFSLVMGQRSQLWWDLPAADSYLLNKEMYSIASFDYTSRLKYLSETLGIADKLTVQVRKLSLGERMKCELIGALLHFPKVVYLDEPTIGLDIVAQHALREFIADFNKNNATTIILTSHYMDDIKALCKRVLLIDQGKLIYDGELSGLTDSFSATKILHITFEENVEYQQLMILGTIIEHKDDYAIIQVAKEDLSACATHIFTNFQVRDITIEDIPVDEIIRMIFSGKTGI